MSRKGFAGNIADGVVSVVFIAIVVYLLAYNLLTLTIMNSSGTLTAADWTNVTTTKTILSTLIIVGAAGLILTVFRV